MGLLARAPAVLRLRQVRRRPGALATKRACVARLPSGYPRLGSPRLSPAHRALGAVCSSRRLMTRATTPTTSRPRAPRTLPAPSLTCRRCKSAPLIGGMDRSQWVFSARERWAITVRHGVACAATRASWERSGSTRIRRGSTLRAPPTSPAQPSQAKPSLFGAMPCHRNATRAPAPSDRADRARLARLARLRAASVLLLVGAPLRTQVGSSRWLRCGTLRYSTVLYGTRVLNGFYGTLRYSMVRHCDACLARRRMAE